MNALMSHRVSADTQGELQGAVASPYSLSSIVGPPIMTQLFGRFSAESSSHRVPGAAFVAAAALAMASFAIYSWVTRPAVVPIADGQLVNPWRVSSARGVRAARRVPP